MVFLALILVIMDVPLVWAEEETGRIVITTEGIKEMNVRTVVELLNRIPGVDAGENTVSLRGSRMVKVLLDGRPINDPLSGHRAIRWNLVSINDIERIEIYKGSGSGAFGDDSSGGVIIIKTKRPKGGKGNIEAFGGNFNTKSCSINYRRNIEPFGVGFSAGWYKKSGYRDNGDKDKRRAGTKISYSPSKEHSFDLSLDFASEDSGRPGLPAYPTPRSRFESETFGSSLISRIRSLKSGTHFSRFRRESRNPDSGLETILKSWSFMEDLKRKFRGISTGINFEIAEVSGNKVSTKQEKKCGIYLAKDHHFKALPLTLSGGARCNLYSEFRNVFNPEIKLSFARDDFTIQTAVVKTNNTPTFLQRYYESSTTSPNPDLGTEKAMNYSITFSYHPIKQIEGSITLFYNRIKDRITYARGEGGIGKYENFGKVTLKGTEISCKWKLCDSIEMKPSYVYLSAKDNETGNWIPCKPEHKVRFDIRYKPLADLTLDLNTKYVSKQYSRSDNKESVSGYFIADLRADYYCNRIRLFMKIENLFDKDYLYGDGYPAPPLTWWTGLSCEF